MIRRCSGPQGGIAYFTRLWGLLHANSQDLGRGREACRARTIATSAEGQLFGTGLLGQCLLGVDIAPDWLAETGLHSSLAPAV